MLCSSRREEPCQIDPEPPPMPPPPLHTHSVYLALLGEALRGRVQVPDHTQDDDVKVTAR